MMRWAGGAGGAEGHLADLPRCLGISPLALIGKIRRSGREIRSGDCGERRGKTVPRRRSQVRRSRPVYSVVGLFLPLEASGGGTLEAAKGSRSEPEPPVAGGGAVTYHEEGVTPRRPDGAGASLWNES